MGRQSHRHEDDLSWPPAKDDVQVLDLTSGQRVPQERLDIHVQRHQPPRAGAVPPAQARTPPATPSWAQAFEELRRTARSHVPVLLVAAAVLVIGAFLLLPATRHLLRFPFGERGTAGADTATAGTSGRDAGATGRSVAAGNTAAAAKTPPASGATTAAPGTAYLAVRTEPPGVTVLLDGRRLGVTPATVPQLAAGEHTITLRGRTQTVEHRIQVTAGETVSLLVPLAATPPTTTAATPATKAAPASESGVSVLATVELRIYEDDQLVGTSQMPRIPLAAGVHRLLLRSDLVGYQDERVVTVAAGRTSAIEVQLPSQRVAINALPWAEVWVDGNQVGETPIGSLSLPLGPHTVVLRHPQLGERTVQALVKAGEPSRISADLRK